MNEKFWEVHGTALTNLGWDKDKVLTEATRLMIGDGMKLMAATRDWLKFSHHGEVFYRVAGVWMGPQPFRDWVAQTNPASKSRYIAL